MTWWQWGLLILVALAGIMGALVLFVPVRVRLRAALPPGRAAWLAGEVRWLAVRLRWRTAAQAQDAGGQGILARLAGGDETGWWQGIETILYLIDTAASRLSPGWAILARRLRVDGLEIELWVSTGDPMLTAMAAGGVWSLVGLGLAALADFLPSPAAARVSVQPEFGPADFSGRAECRLRITGFAVLKAAAYWRRHGQQVLQELWRRANEPRQQAAH